MSSVRVIEQLSQLKWQNIAERASNLEMSVADGLGYGTGFPPSLIFSSPSWRIVGGSREMKDWLKMEPRIDQAHIGNRHSDLEAECRFVADRRRPTFFFALSE